MARHPSPWFRAGKGAWYVKVDGRQIRLGTDKGEALRAYHALMADRDLGGSGFRPASIAVTDVFDLFLDDRLRRVERGDLAQVTLDGYVRFLPRAAAHLGRLQADRLRPHHVEAWVDGQGWGATTRFNAITALKAAFRWAHRQGHLTENPIEKLERPTPQKRQTIPDAATVAAWRAAWSDKAGQQLITALVESGCRPGEIYTLTAADVDLVAGVWYVRNKTRRKTGQAKRTVYLTPRLLDLTRQLIEAYPEGPLFRNRSGRSWTRHAVGCRFNRLRKAGVAAPGDSAYALRHLYVTDALERGVDLATLAELVGHRDATMILRVYSKLATRRDHLRAAASQIRPDQPAA